MKRIVVIGGGASGIVAAIEAARTDRKAKVYILEQKEKLGKKILATGNGRCNLTNLDMTENAFRGDSGEIVTRVLQLFDQEQTLNFFSSLGLVTKCRDTYVYPRSDQAQTVVMLLEKELERLGVFCITDVKVEDILPGKSGFRIQTTKETLQADKVILACGGKADSALGSDGSGYALAKSLGHCLSPVVPALVPLKVKKYAYSKASGVRTDAKVTAIVNGKVMAEDVGELQMTAYGISGIPNRLIRRIYELRAITINGEGPQVFECISCGDKEREKVFSVKRGGLLCSECAGIASDGVILLPSTWYTLQYIVSAPIEKLYTFVVKEDVMIELEHLIDAYLGEYLGRRFKSLEILETIAD